MEWNEHKLICWAVDVATEIYKTADFSQSNGNKIDQRIKSDSKNAVSLLVKAAFICIY